MIIEATIIFTASNSVKFTVPDDTPRTTEALESAIKREIKDHGLPEVLNDDIDFMFPQECSIEVENKVHEFELEAE